MFYQTVTTQIWFRRFENEISFLRRIQEGAGFSWKKISSDYYIFEFTHMVHFSLDWGLAPHFEPSTIDQKRFLTIRKTDMMKSKGNSGFENFCSYSIANRLWPWILQKKKNINNNVSIVSNTCKHSSIRVCICVEKVKPLYAVVR